MLNARWGTEPPRTPMTAAARQLDWDWHKGRSSPEDVLPGTGFTTLCRGTRGLCCQAGPFPAPGFRLLISKGGRTHLRYGLCCGQENALQEVKCSLSIPEMSIYAKPFSRIRGYSSKRDRPGPGLWRGHSRGQSQMTVRR